MPLAPQAETSVAATAASVDDEAIDIESTAVLTAAFAAFETVVVAAAAVQSIVPGGPRPRPPRSQPDLPQIVIARRSRSPSQRRGMQRGGPARNRARAGAARAGANSRTRRGGPCGVFGPAVVKLTLGPLPLGPLPLGHVARTCRSDLSLGLPARSHAGIPCSGSRHLRCISCISSS